MSIATSPTSPRRDEGAFAPYVRAVRHHPWLVGAVVVAAFLMSVAYASVRKPTYEASAQILVTPYPDSSPFPTLPILTDSGDPARMLQTASSVLSSPKAAVVAARALGLSNPSELSSAVTVEAEGDSDVVAVTAATDTAEKAIAFADAAARAAVDVHRDQLKILAQTQLDALKARLQAIREVDPASAVALAEPIQALETLVESDRDINYSLLQQAGGAEATGTPKWMLVLLGLMAGLVIGVGSALALEQLDRRIKDEEGVLEAFPLPVLTRVPVLRRRLEGGSPGMPPLPVREAFRTLQVQLEGDGERSRVVMLTSASSGDGKTTSSIDLAAALAATGRRVLLLDLDLRKPDVGPRLGVASDRLALFRSNVSLADMVVPVPAVSGLRVLSAPMRGDVLPVLDALSRRLPDLLEEAREIADYVIIDTAPVGRVSDALRIAAVADHILLVTRPGNTNRKDLALARELLQHMGITPTGMVVVGSSGSSHGYYGSMDDTPIDLSAAAARPAARRRRQPDDQLDVAP